MPKGSQKRSYASEEVTKTLFQALKCYPDENLHHARSPGKRTSIK